MRKDNIHMYSPSFTNKEHPHETKININYKDDAQQFMHTWSNEKKLKYLTFLFPEDIDDLNTWIDEVTLDIAFYKIYILFGASDFF